IVAVLHSSEGVAGTITFIADSQIPLTGPNSI
uniref:Superoxide dismutase [Cu-Zn] (Fragments) n=1 Tax=Striga hermonthica TaxID=68872 RepID=SODC_STRHE|nr:RecName: Full=Superoxide dismutase [Cu-Zn] [Striga hermonthica]